MTTYVQDMSQRYTASIGAADPGHLAALKQLWALAYREASTLAYADAFQAIMVAFIVATAFVPLLRKVAPPATPPADAH
jgi:DHA2 family multidrug resistance protein